MLRYGALAGSLVIATSVLACGGAEPARIDPAQRPQTPRPAPTSGDAASSEAAAGDEAAADAEPTPFEIQTFNVAECDSYIKKYLACIEGHIPSEQRRGWMESLAANQTRWRTLAAMKEGRVALSLACKAAASASKEALAVDYGCEF